MQIKRNILLNPGPASTTDTVKMAQVVPDICPRENEFTELITDINKSLLTIAATNPEDYDCILFGGSGTAVVEAILSSVVNELSCVLIINNGAYGNRMTEIADIHGLNFIEYWSSYKETINIEEVEKLIFGENEHPITHLATVHHETTTGLLNDIWKLGDLAKRHDLELIVDAISSFGAIDIDMEKMNINYLAATSNKNLQSMAGLGFVISRIDSLKKIERNRKKSLYLDLFDQYQYFLNKGQFRFTPPVQTLYALKQAIDELRKETVSGRYSRYAKSWETLVNGMDKLGFHQYVPLDYQSKLICTFYEPDNFDFNDFHDYLYDQDITIYPGKVVDENTFRIGTIGDVNCNDIKYFLKCVEEYLLMRPSGSSE